MIDQAPKTFGFEDTARADFPPPEAVAQILSQRVFDLSGDEIRYRSDLSSKVGPWKDEMHSPLAQLYFIFKRGLIPHFQPASFTGEYRETPYPGAYTKKTAEVQTEAFPSDILELINMDPVAEATSIKSLVAEKIISAQNILLAGCINAPVAYRLVEVLHQQGFRGNLDIYDISTAPLALIDVYSEIFKWQKNYGISVKTQLADLRMLQKYEYRKYQVIIADILGHYLTTPEVIDHFSAVPLYILSDKGIMLVRDMEETVSVAPEQRVVSGNTSMEVTPEDIAFQKWLKQYFGHDIQLDAAVKTRTSLYPDPNHEPRMGSLREMWDYSMAPFMRLRYVLSTVPKGSNLARLFQILVFTRDKKTEVEELLPDSPTTDGSLHAVCIQ